MAIDHDTLDPEEIRTLPVRRDLPYNGLTEEQVRALGFDPAAVEQARVDANEYAQAKQTEDDVQFVVAAQTAVENGQMTYGEAALWLRNSGRNAAHDAFVQEWYEEETRERAEAAADEITFADADEYLRAFTAQQEHERVSAERTAAQTQQEEAEQLAAQIRERLDATVPTDHPLRAGIEAALVHQLTEAEAPRNDVGQDTLIRGAVQRAAVLDSASESIRQQAEQEWRILRKTQGKSGDLMTQADIDSAKEQYINGRLQQLGDSTTINHDDLKAPPIAEEEQAKYVERFGSRNGRSTSLHSAVGEIEQRGREAEAVRAKGGATYGSGSEHERYRAAVRLAEENARVAEEPTGDAPQVQSRNPDRPDLPPSWADEYGPAGYST